jgi:type I restriction-modification system DNA methylase subunit
MARTKKETAPQPVEQVLWASSVVSVYGQESNQTTWRLCKMNLALRGIDSTNVKWNNEGSFLNDERIRQNLAKVEVTGE